MIGRAKGATLAEIMQATGWQAHSVRGFVSTAGKKHGIKIDSGPTDATKQVGLKFAFVTDPIGTRIELTEGLTKQ